MAKRPVAAVLGDINRDLFVRVRYFPRPGSDNPAEESAWALGGSAANTAVDLARLGVPSSVIGRIGRDPEGRALLKELSRFGVHTGAVQRDSSRATGLCIVTVTGDGERTLVGIRGANCALQRDGIAEAVESVQHLHVSGYALIQPESRRAAFLALETVRKRGGATSLDFGWQPSTSSPELVRRALRHVSLALPSAQELRTAFGERRLSRAAGKAMDLGVEYVAVTLGAGGCKVFSPDGSFRLPRLESRTVNTCGAGDAFNAGYILGMREGASPDACAFLGNAAGSAVVESDSSHEAVTRERLTKIILRAKQDPQLERFASAADDAVRVLATKPRKRRKAR